MYCTKYVHCTCAVQYIKRINTELSETRDEYGYTVLYFYSIGRRETTAHS